MTERRRILRYELGIAGKLLPAGQSVGENVLIRDISTRGCKLEHAEGLGLGEYCKLCFEWRGTQLGLLGQVAWKSAKRQMGLKFLTVDENSQQRLKEICAALATELLLASEPNQADAAHSAKASISPTLVVASQRNRRRFPRYSSDLACRLSCPATGTASEARLVNLSVGGGCLEGAGLPHVTQICELDSEWEGRRFVVSVEVVWKAKKRAGVRFLPLDESMGKLLNHICAHSPLETPGPPPS